MSDETINQQGYKILIVDDDQFLLDMYAVKFKAAHFEVEATPDPAAALKKLRDGYVPDAIMLDVVMPGIDGIEMLKQIRAEHLGGNAPVIMLTNQSQQADVDVAQEVGVDGYIVKAEHVPSEVIQEVTAIIIKKKTA